MGVFLASYMLPWIRVYLRDNSVVIRGRTLLSILYGLWWCLVGDKSTRGFWRCVSDKAMPIFLFDRVWKFCKATKNSCCLSLTLFRASASKLVLFTQLLEWDGPHGLFSTEVWLDLTEADLQQVTRKPYEKRFNWFWFANSGKGPLCEFYKALRVQHLQLDWSWRCK